MKEMMERSDLSVVSLGCMASGPEYTYCSEDVRTLVDYILMDVEATLVVPSCLTHTTVDLNTSYHLPLTVSLIYDLCSMTDVSASQGLPKIDWEKARKMGAFCESSANWAGSLSEQPVWRWR